MEVSQVVLHTCRRSDIVFIGIQPDIFLKLSFYIFFIYFLKWLGLMNWDGGGPGYFIKMLIGQCPQCPQCPLVHNDLDDGLPINEQFPSTLLNV